MKSKNYIILGYSKETDAYIGYVEHSFSMGFSTSRVNLWRPHQYGSHSYNDKEHFFSKSINEYEYRYCKERCKRLNEITVNRIIDKGMSNCDEINELRDKFKGYDTGKLTFDFRVYRIGSKYCPVSIDWTERVDMNRGKLKRDKFLWRNPKFKKRGMTE